MGDAKPGGLAAFLRVCGHRPQSDEEGTRFVHINDAEGRELHKQIYVNNKTSTTKYSPLSYFPKALFEQYRPWTTFLPLVLVLGVSMGKEAIEDWKRYRADQEVNNRPVRVFDQRTKQLVVKRWQDIVVGDIVEVKRDEYFPADLLMLTAENEEGICYTETMNLDGETNLKIKKALDQTKTLRESNLADLAGFVECEPPNPRLYTFTGNLKLIAPFVGEQDKLPLGAGCILLRGASLRNTARIFGLVIYAGHDTKVFKNATQAPSKRSRIERGVDWIIVCTFSMLISMCLTGCIYFAFWTANEMPRNWYLGPENTEGSNEFSPDKPAIVGVTNFITAFILYGYLIPISLYVSIEMVKICQAMVFINNDIAMYHEDTDTRALARTSNLNEELGMVDTILSDKTGTLTRNVMEFFKCSIAGVSYGAGTTEVEIANAERKGQTVTVSKDPNLEQYRERFFNFYDKRLMDRAWTREPRAEIIEQFFRLLAICHSVIPDGPPDEHEIKYEAESPDEAALVVAAKVLGFFFYKRTNTTVWVKETTVAGVRDVEYEILNLLEFNSTRKRMSVIFRDPQGRIVLLTKGADSVIYDLLDHTHPLNKEFKAVTKDHMENYASAGLRTLCLAYSVLDPAVYEGWQQQYFEAKTALVDREQKLMAVAESIERNLILLGATAIEDKLQEGVPRCIKRLAMAGIRIWVLTGDKMETAINIGYACSLLTDEMLQSQITAAVKQVEDLEEQGKQAEADAAAVSIVRKQLDTAYKNIVQSPLNALIIDGKALHYALREPSLRQRFMDVGTRCKAVICCRVSPLQKAQVTGLVKSKGDITLAIGDGANDVGMIQKAHIGVGISGQEGMQAVQNSDFAIAQFAYLETLLLVHGRWNYRRISRMVCFFFYKNVMFGTSIFIYNSLTTFSGQIIFDDFYMSLFNVIFTSITPIVIGIFDRDVDRELALKYPVLYQDGQRNRCFSVRVIAWWFAMAFYQCGILTTIAFVASSPLAANRMSGMPWTHWELGVLLMTFIVLTIHLQISTIFEQWTWLHHLGIYLSIAVWFLYLLVYGNFPLSFAQDLYVLFQGIIASGSQYWIFLIAVPFTAVLPEFFLRRIKRIFFPDDNMLVAEAQKKGILQDAEAGRGRLGKAQTGTADSDKRQPAARPPRPHSPGMGKLARDASLSSNGEVDPWEPALRQRLAQRPAAGGPQLIELGPAKQFSPVKGGDAQQHALRSIHLPPVDATLYAHTHIDVPAAHGSTNSLYDMPARLPDDSSSNGADLPPPTIDEGEVMPRRPIFPSSSDSISHLSTPSTLTPLSHHSPGVALDSLMDIRRPVFPPPNIDSATQVPSLRGAPGTVNWSMNVMASRAPDIDGQRSAEITDDFYAAALQRTPSQIVSSASGDARNSSPVRPGLMVKGPGPADVYRNGMFGLADEDRALL